MKDIDQEEYQKASQNKPATQDEKDEARRARDQKWDKINAKLKEKDGHFVEPGLPYDANKVVKDYNDVYEKIYRKA